MEKLEVLVNEDFDMEVQGRCTGSCTADCEVGPNNCTSNIVPWT
ncbi:hypothetical protein UY416_15830 [Paenibacillus polymyxa]|nr:hypothetical protein [Paenibacillus polymyxa]MDY8047760.1 hypothetical protein [Paenibacillus polymyxa]